MRLTFSLLATLVLALVVDAAIADNVIAYPAKGQDGAQRSKDRSECRSDSMNTTGFNPATPPPTYQAARNASSAQAKTQYDEAMAQYRSQSDDFDRAVSACLSGRGYTVR